MFLLSELLLNFVFIIQKSIAIALREKNQFYEKHNPFHYIYNFIQDTGFQTTIEAAGFLFIKSSKDNIQGLQHLEYMQLMSSVQIPTEQFMPNVYISMTWKELSISEQE